MRWTVGKEDWRSCWACQHAGSRTVITEVTVWTIYHANCRTNVTIESWVWGASCYASPGWVVSVWAWRTLSHTSLGSILCEGVFRTVCHTEGGWIIGKSAPICAVLHTLPGGIFPKRVVWTSEHTSQCTILGVGPGVGRTNSYTFFGWIVSKSHWPSACCICIRTSCHTLESQVVSICIKIFRTELNTSSCVIVGKLFGSDYTAFINTLSCVIVCPGAYRTSIGAVVRNIRGDRAGTDACVGWIISKSVRKSRTSTHTKICRIISILPPLTIAVRYTSMQQRISILQLRTVMHAQSRTILREEGSHTEINTSPLGFVSKSVNNRCIRKNYPSRTPVNTGLSLIVGEEPSRA